MHLRSLVALVCAAAIVAACNINVQMPLSQSEQQAAATIVAQTMQAAANANVTPFASPGPGGTAGTAAASGPAKLTINANSNCRTGPGANFKVITAFTTGTELPIVARNAANNWWQVQIPNSTEFCWVWGQYVTTTGNVDTLPESTPQVSTGGVPTRPGSLFYTYTCDFGALTTTLSWSDAADNESGYRVYRWDQQIADLPPNSTTYTDNATVTPGAALQYSVEAYNDAGASAKRTVDFACQ